MASRHPDIVCDLCGLPVGGNDIKHAAESGVFHFCCHGCKQVFFLLSAASGVLPEGFRETELYRVCVESGIVPAPGPVAHTRTPRDAPGVPSLEFSCRVEGMWCPSCAWLIEEVLHRMTGVTGPSVSFVSDRLHLTYLPHIISPGEIVGRIGRLGYRLITRSEETGGEENEGTALPLSIAAFLTGNIMMVSVFFYGFFELSPAALRSFSWPVLAMASLVIFWAGLPILKRGFAQAAYGKASMDTLISIGTLSAYAYSLVQMGLGGVHLYFDTASMLVTTVLFGRYIESRAKRGIRAGMADLNRLAHGKVRTIREGRQTWLAADTVRPGQPFLVSSGEMAALDGRVIDGSATVDESLLTGESAPQKRLKGDILRAGSTVLDGDVTVEAIATTDESLAGQIITAMEKALVQKAGYQRLAENISRFFVPVILGTAAATFFFAWMSGSPSGKALLRALTVLVISCPCTLGIAIPLAKACAVFAARKAGIIVGDPEALERLHGVDTVILDKTGTVTEGNFLLKEIHCRLDPVELFFRLASVELHSRHVIGRQIVREARERGSDVIAAPGFRAYQGLGVSAQVNGSAVYIGNRALMADREIAVSRAMDEEAAACEDRGDTCAFFAWDGTVRGFLVFGDAVRKNADTLIAKLRERDIAVRLVSGDAEATTGAVARLLGIKDFTGSTLPDGKAKLVESLRARGHRVAMIGDGINDGPALATADAGLAFGAGSNLIGGIADISFLSADPGKIIDAYNLSAMTRRTTHQNLFFAFVYNAVAIPVAALGMLDPFIAVLAMVGSSLTVMGNTLRMSRMLQENHSA